MSWRHFPINTMFLSGKMGVFRPLYLRLPLFLDYKTLCSKRYVSKNVPGVTAFQRHSPNLFCSVSKFQEKSSVTSKVLIIYHEYLSKLIPKSISCWKWKKKKILKSWSFASYSVWSLTISKVIEDKIRNATDFKPLGNHEYMKKNE